jgi:hypothetical protein
VSLVHYRELRMFVMAIVMLALAFSMSIYWEGVARAFTVVFPVQGESEGNPGLMSASSYESIDRSEPEVSTLLEEFPLLDPYYAEEGDSIVFHTSFGQYAFSKNQPWMSFAYRDGTPLIRHSVFYVNSTMQSPILLRDYEIDKATLTRNHLEYSATLQSGAANMGQIHVSISFDRVQRPKITAKVDASPLLNSAG